jgi:RPA family protein
MAEIKKRSIAYKFKIADIIKGSPVMQDGKLESMDIFGRKVNRVNVVGNIINKYVSDGEKKYIFITIDDASGQISIKAFSDDIEKIKDLIQGQTIVVIGLLRYFNDQVYITPEIVREINPKYLLVRKLELERKQSQMPKLNKEERIELKDNILTIIKNAEYNQGAETDKIIMQINDASPETIHQEIRRLIEEGVIFEPRPGKVRWLG